MILRLFSLGILLTFIFSTNVFAEKNEKIEEILNNYYKEGKYSGGLLVKKGQKNIFKGAVGLANREWNIKNTTQTKFRINSITKQFTALLLMQLVEEDKLVLDKPIINYLPEFPKSFGEKIIVRNLLMNTSGLPGFDIPEFYAGQDKRLTNFGYLTKKYLTGNLVFEPGKKFNYNNADFLVAGAIIEKLTGKPFEKVLKEKILVPLGMKDTGVIRKGSIIRNLADGYIYQNGGFSKEPFYNIENYGPAGAMYSTLEDMHLWNRALIENKLLSKELTQEMFTPSRALGFVALGSWVYDMKFADGKSYKLIERQGGIGGFSSLNIISPEEKLSIVFLGNVQTGTLFRTYAKQGLSFEILKVIKNTKD